MLTCAIFSSNKFNMAKANHLSITSKISYALSNYLGRMVATKSIRENILSFFYSREYKEVALCNILPITKALYSFLTQNNIKIKYIISDSVMGGGIPLDCKVYKPNRWNIPSVDAIIVLPHPDTQHSVPNIRSTIKELDKYISCPIYSVFDLFKKSTLIKPIKKNYMFYRELDPKYYAQELSAWYKQRTGEELNLIHPKTFGDKIQWLKLYDNSELKTKLADKYAVREWVKKKIGESYLIPLLGVYDKPEDINYDLLPNEFVIKCNHGSGMNIVVKDKSTLDKTETEEKLNLWLSQNYAFRHGAGFELNYKNIPPKILIEKKINQEGYDDLIDYKILCFNGKPKFFQVIINRSTDMKLAFYDTNWVKYGFTYDYPVMKEILDKPDNLASMIDIAEKLCEGIKYVRVDLYRLQDGTIYFGEMTFYPALGLHKWNDKSMDKVFADMLSL